MKSPTTIGVAALLAPAFLYAAPPTPTALAAETATRTVRYSATATTSPPSSFIAIEDVDDSAFAESWSDWSDTSAIFTPFRPDTVFFPLRPGIVPDSHDRNPSASLPSSIARHHANDLLALQDPDIAYDPDALEAFPPYDPSAEPEVSELGFDPDEPPFDEDLALVEGSQAPPVYGATTAPPLRAAYGPYPDALPSTGPEASIVPDGPSAPLDPPSTPIADSASTDPRTVAPTIFEEIGPPADSDILARPLSKVCEGLWKLPRVRQRPFKVGEELGYELSVAGAYIGRFETKVGRPRQVRGRRVLPLFGRARTTGFAKAFKPFIGRYMSMATTPRLAPLGLRVEAKYDEDQRWERVEFGAGGKAVRADFTLLGRRLQRDYSSNHEMTDLLSMLYLAREVDVRDGLVACQHVFGARRLWEMKATVDGTERLSTPAGRMDAWRVKVSFDRMPTPGLNNKKRPHYDMDVFLATDSARTPLAFVVSYRGITARGDLKRWSLKGKSGDDSWTF